MRLPIFGIALSIFAFHLYPLFSNFDYLPNRQAKGHRLQALVHSNKSRPGSISLSLAKCIPELHRMPGIDLSLRTRFIKAQIKVHHGDSSSVVEEKRKER